MPSDCGRSRARAACPDDAEHGCAAQVDERGHICHHRVLARRGAGAHDAGGLDRRADAKDEPVVVTETPLPEAWTALLDELEDKAEIGMLERAAEGSRPRGRRSSGSPRPRGGHRVAQHPPMRQAPVTPIAPPLPEQDHRRHEGEEQHDRGVASPGQGLQRARAAPATRAAAADALRDAAAPPASGSRRRESARHEAWSHVHEHPPVAYAVSHRRHRPPTQQQGAWTPPGGRRPGVSGAPTGGKALAVETRRVGGVEVADGDVAVAHSQEAVRP